MAAGRPPRVSVVILTALGATHLPECLSALKAQTYPADRFDIIVVDNASSEDPTTAITALFPEATVIRNRRQSWIRRRIQSRCGIGNW